MPPVAPPPASEPIVSAAPTVSTAPAAFASDTWQLLGADCSYYTAKISAFLRYKRIPHQNILATREIFAEHILPRTAALRDAIVEGADSVAALALESF